MAVAFLRLGLETVEALFKFEPPLELATAALTPPPFAGEGPPGAAVDEFPPAVTLGDEAPEPNSRT